MRIIILTSVRCGFASRVLPVLCGNTSLNIVKVVLSQGFRPNRKAFHKRRIIKTCRIGILGALNGIRLRDWYADKEAEDIYSVCRSLNIQVSETESTNSDVTRQLFRQANADLGLSLGNGYIAKSVFSIPQYGMINIHTEILPEFQGAQSIIWPIHEMKEETGFTIHQIDSTIDTGNILYQEQYPIQFHKSLRETVRRNMLETRLRVPEAFAHVCENYTTLKAKAISQKKGKSYTTPTFWQFLRMVRNNRLMYNKSLSRHST